MSKITLHEQLQKLRKEKGLTQEALAEIFRVTNQAVSKWESGSCYPDIALLPEIADFYGVSIDALFGKGKPSEYSKIIEDIRALFRETPESECFALALKIALYLHEGVVSKGYKAYLPWDAAKALNPETWGRSACSEPEGVTIAQRGVVLLSDQRIRFEISPDDIMGLWSEIQKYADIDRLTVFFALYELTRRDFDLFVGIQEIGDKAKMSEEKIREIFKRLPIHHKRLDDGSIGYRIEGSNMHIPTLLTLFIVV
ncbi:MAG: helix-turn-helix domain-containing protein [Oscillospiraceae bacterium]|nr:helix-turn-helix domain-containing protein [Oscillospiraceae bacterium]